MHRSCRRKQYTETKDVFDTLIEFCFFVFKIHSIKEFSKTDFQKIEVKV